MVPGMLESYTICYAMQCLCAMRDVFPYVTTVQKQFVCVYNYKQTRSETKYSNVVTVFSLETKQEKKNNVQTQMHCKQTFYK